MRITPEIIVDRFAQRLSRKYETDTYYVLYSTKGCEKWLQYELYLCFEGELYPVAYNKEFKELLAEGNEAEGDQLADIILEYRVDSKSNQYDICIAETPFMSRFIDDKASWRSRASIKAIEDDYLKTFWHYIELKVEWASVNPNEQGKLLDGFTSDIERLQKASKEIRKPGKAISAIAISVVRLYDSVGEQNTIEGFEKIIDELRTKRVGQNGIYDFHLISPYAGVLSWVCLFKENKV